MHVNLDLEIIAKVLGAIITIITFASLVVSPFIKVMRENKSAMASLEKAISELLRDIKDSKEDRKNIHLILDKHEERLDKVEDKVIEIDTVCKTKERC